MQNPPQVELSVGQFVDLVNNSFEYSFSYISVIGELANFRISKNQWVYFDLKDDTASIKCFGIIYNLPAPLEDGMTIQVFGAPRLHNQYGFSFNFQSIQPIGEGTIKKAAKLLEAKLTKEGLFDVSRKRPLPYPPTHIGLITSGQSAAYADFIKILGSRWGGIKIDFIDVAVQGESSEKEICDAIEKFNLMPKPPEVLVITRGGGSPEDLWVFSAERLTRSVAASRIPTLIAIGHEIDNSLAEMAADVRASTPSNAAEILVPDKQDYKQSLRKTSDYLNHFLDSYIENFDSLIERYKDSMKARLDILLESVESKLVSTNQLLNVLDPNNALKRGYAIIRSGNQLVRDGVNLTKNDIINITLRDSKIDAVVKDVFINDRKKTEK